MKVVLTGAAIIAAAAIGFSAGRTPKSTAEAADPHAEHLFPHSGPAFEGYQQSAAIPASYKEAPEGWKVAQPADQADRGNWWAIYADPQLDDLEKSYLQVVTLSQQLAYSECQRLESVQKFNVTLTDAIARIKAKHPGYTLVNGALAPKPVKDTK